MSICDALTRYLCCARVGAVFYSTGNSGSSGNQDMELPQVAAGENPHQRSEPIGNNGVEYGVTDTAKVASTQE